MSNNINNKEKQAAGGNWGHPRKYTKRKTKIPNPLIPECSRSSRKRKKKKDKKPYIWHFEVCPFCGEERKKLNNKDSWFRNREDFCRKCGAKEVKGECPACHRTAWIKNEYYKHEGFYTCGFSGKKFNSKEISERKI